VARSPRRSATTLEAAERLDVRPMLWPMDDVSDVLPGADVVISTLPPGAADRLVRPDQAGPGVLLDVVYAPWPTALAQSWAVGGGPVVSGLEMLVHQAAEQVRLWSGRVPDIAAMRTAGLVESAADGKPT
jgi:shikimate dehydrogenase